MKQKDFDEILRELEKQAIPVQRNRKGEPVYRIIVDVTEKEYRMLKKKLRSMRE